MKGASVYIVDDNDETLKTIKDYAGPIPTIGQKIVFLSGGVFEVSDITWQSSKEEWYPLTCYIIVKNVS